MAEIGAKNTAVRVAAEKGLYIVDPERIGAGPPKEGKYTESKKSYYVRKYMEAQAARSTPEKGN